VVEFFGGERDGELRAVPEVHATFYMAVCNAEPISMSEPMENIVAILTETVTFHYERSPYPNGRPRYVLDR
jgi:hypothetical protein